MAGEDDAVGFKKPPKGSQFKPGQSGNPRGRPTGSVSFKADLAAEMRERITLRDRNGVPRRVTKQRALIKLLFSSALQNEKSSISALLACMRYFGTEHEEPVTDTVDLEDLDMIKSYVARTEARKKQEKEATQQPTLTKGKARK